MFISFFIRFKFIFWAKIVFLMYLWFHKENYLFLSYGLNSKTLNLHNWKIYTKKFVIILNLNLVFTLMNELIKCMLTICTWLPPDYRTSRIVNSLTTSGNVFSITFHIPLLKVGSKSMHILKQMIKSINIEIPVYILHINTYTLLSTCTGPIWMQSYGIWIYIYLYSQCPCELD